MLQFVPVHISLSDDAPGYDNTDTSNGPICWKCDGKGTIEGKKYVNQCSVCDGKKRLRVKSRMLKGSLNAGIITKRSAPDDWLPRAPRCAYGSMEQSELPVELQPQNGEQLCVLVGDWRIFQRLGGHRWTTDDLVTGWVAGRKSRLNSSTSTHVRTALDLGCGNGSVLMMVAWQYPLAHCIGVEARSEAVALARRSVWFNCGKGDSSAPCRVSVLNEDFRRLIHDQTRLTEDSINSETDEFLRQPAGESILRCTQKFDLITGTPPYFRVDFQVSISKSDLGKCAPASAECVTVGAVSTVERALIRQGGMPTCKESAPARCEFRGGIEAYCAAAASNLATEGTFVVCENWANHDRVLAASREARLQIVSMQRVIGREGKPPLFCVYTMIHPASITTASITTIEVPPAPTYGCDNISQLHCCSVDSGDRAVVFVPPPAAAAGTEESFEDDLIVRDKQGAWTERYVELLNDMNYPIVSLQHSSQSLLR